MTSTRSRPNQIAVVCNASGTRKLRSCSLKSVSQHEETSCVTWYQPQFNFCKLEKAQGIVVDPHYLVLGRRHVTCWFINFIADYPPKRWRRSNSLLVPTFTLCLPVQDFSPSQKPYFVNPMFLLQQESVSLSLVIFSRSLFSLSDRKFTRALEYEEFVRILLLTCTVRLMLNPHWVISLPFSKPMVGLSLCLQHICASFQLKWYNCGSRLYAQVCSSRFLPILHHW